MVVIVPLLPSPFANAVLPLLRPLRGWLREDVFDYYGRILHPQLQLQRVLARVVARRMEGDSTLVLTLAPSRHWQGLAAGQHVALTTEIRGVRHTRCYSPMPQSGGLIEVGIKRQPGGLVSGYLHDYAKVGQYLEIGQAQGQLLLPEPAPAKWLLLAAGSGITPLLSMLRARLAQGSLGDVVLLYYGRRRRELAFVEELRAMPGLRLQVCLTGEPIQDGETAGRLSAAQLALLVPDATERQAYACGAYGFTDTANTLWQDGAFASLVVESFSPPNWQVEDDMPVQLTYQRSNRQLAGRTGGTLLEQAEAHGLKPAHGCRMGICNTCTCHKREGAVRDLRTGKISMEPDETIRLCITAPVGDVVLDL
ncbi:MAG TPA: ferredoxin reductase [Chitinimonas sp.]